MKNMKRWLAAILSLVLCLGVCPALADPGYVTLQGIRDPSEDFDLAVNSVVAYDGVFYFSLIGGQVYACKAGEEAWSLYMNGLPEYDMGDMEDVQGDSTYYFFMTENGPYVFDYTHGALVKLAVAEDGTATVEKVLHLGLNENLVNIEEYDDKIYAYSYEQNAQALMGNQLFMVVTNYYETGDGLPHLFAMDLETGETTAYPVENVQYIAPYKDGKLLCLVYDQNARYDENQEFTISLSAFDPATGELVVLKQLDPETSTNNVGGVAYDEAEDILYMISDQGVYRSVAQGDMELCAYSPLTYFNTSGMGMGVAVANGYAAFANSSTGAHIRSIAPENLPNETLTIYQAWEGDAHRKAVETLGNVPVLAYDKEYFSTAQDMAQALVSGEDQIDILCINVSYIDLQRLMEKGYCEDLSSSEALTSFVNSTYGVVQDVLTMDGKVYAVPFSLNLISFGSYMGQEAFETFMNESGMKIPENYLDLIQFMKDWGEKGYYETYSDYRPIESEQVKSLLLSSILEDYFYYLEATKQELTMDSPVLRNALAALEELDTSDWEEEIDWDDDDAWDDYFSKTALFDSYINIDIEDHSWNTVIPLSMSEDTDPAIPMQLEVMFINPRSQHKETAIRYMEAYVAALEESVKASLCPDRNDPVENPYYQSNLDSMEDYLADLNKQLEKATEEDVKEALQERITNYEASIADYRENSRYSITEKSIAAYRALDKYFFVPTVKSNFYQYDEVRSLRNQYQEGLINLDQFIQQADAKLRLMQLENQ